MSTYCLGLDVHKSMWPLDVVLHDIRGADTSQITNVRMGINRYQTSDLARRRGVLGWFSSNPGGSWVRGASHEGGEIIKGSVPWLDGE